MTWTIPETKAISELLLSFEFYLEIWEVVVTKEAKEHLLKNLQAKNRQLFNIFLLKSVLGR